MKEHEILDEIFFDKKSDSSTLISIIKIISKWWFQKRMYYNIILILFQALIFIIFFDTITFWYGFQNGLKQAFAFTIVANILFTLGSVVDIVAAIFKYDLSEFRRILWLTGLWISVLVTAYLYIDTVW